MGGGISLKLPLHHPRHFEIHSVLGKGGFAIVYEAVHRTNRKLVAVKQTFFPHPEQNEHEIDMTLTELAALKQGGDHPFIIKLHSAFREYSTCYLVLDLLVGGDIRYQLRNFQLFQEHHVAYFISCIGLALHHIHLKGIIHRDVKPENILLGHTGRPYLSDFGTSYVITDPNMLPYCTAASGTLPYLAPEVLTISRCHSYQADFWSLGIVAYELLFHCRPFDTHCSKEFIYYADNEYHLVWEYITHAHQQVVTQRASQLQEQQQQQQAQDQQSQGQNGQVPAEVSFPGYLHDFNAIYSSISPAIIRQHLPYPDHYPPPTDSPSSPDDHLPDPFRVPIPTHTYCGDLISAECLSFIKSLLDIRIHRRLGQLNQFQEFIENDWIQSYGYHSLERLDSCRPAFQPNVEEIQSILKNRFSEATKQVKLNYQREVSSEMTQRRARAVSAPAAVAVGVEEPVGGGIGGEEIADDDRQQPRRNETIPYENEESASEMFVNNIPLHIELKLQKYSHNPPGPIPSLLGFQSLPRPSYPVAEMKSSQASPMASLNGSIGP
jgi:serine/threonine protein kinase